MSRDRVAGAPEERARLRAGVVYCLKVFLAMRAGLFLLGLVAVALIPPLEEVSVPGWPAHPITPGPHNLFTAWERFDGLWFLRIATSGYAAGDGSAAFFPLYPLAIRVVSTLIGGHPFAASLLVSNASFLGALLVLYFLTASELSEAAARKAVVYAAVFPTSFFFLAPYSESLFLLLSVMAFWLARRHRWPAAGVAGALAALTRNVGLLLAPALAVEAIQQWREGRKGLPLRLLCAVLPALGTLAYLGFWQLKSGEPLAPFTQQANWLRVRSWPWVSLARSTKEAFRWFGQYPGGYHLLDWLIVVPAIAVAAYGIVRFRPAYSLYTLAGILVPLSFVFFPRPLMSVPRFLLPLFPLYWGLAELSERRRLPHHLVVGVCAAALGVLALLFFNWYYIF